MKPLFIHRVRPESDELDNTAMGEQRSVSIPIGSYSVIRHRSTFRDTQRHPHVMDIR